MKKIILLISAGLLILILIICAKSCSGDANVQVTTEKVEARNIIETVSANGKIQPEVQVKISSDVSGEIVELPVLEGQHVKKGELLARINPDLYTSALDRMSATLNSSKANLATARARLSQVKAQFANTESTFNRNKKLFDQGAISQADFDAAKAAYEGAKADVDAAQETVNASDYNVKSTEASLKEANDNLSKTSIYAPVDGTISKLNVEKGERVVGTAQMTGTELLIIANLNEMEVSVDVNENDIVRVNLNDTTLIEVDAYLDRKFKGIVTEIANSANTTGVTADQVTNFTVKIRILQESYKDLLGNQPGLSPFRPGMSATVDIQTKSVPNALSVPIQSVTTRSKQNEPIEGEEQKQENENNDVVVKNTKEKKEDVKEIKPEECVFVYVDGKAKMVKVKTGIQDNNFIEITQGLTKDQEVITAPYNAVSKLLKDDMPVQKVDKLELFSGGKPK